jgi:hypothetical protein
MRPDWLISIKNVPNSPEGHNGQTAKADSHGTPPSFQRAVESYSRLLIGVPGPSLA